MDLSALPWGAAAIVALAWGYHRHKQAEENDNGTPEDRGGPDPR